MNRLSSRLALAIVVTTLLAVGLVALIANRVATREFRRYVTGNESAAAAWLLPALAEYYQTAGSWQGVEGSIEAVLNTTPGLARYSRGRAATLLLADAERRVIYDNQGVAVGKTLTRAEQESALPITPSSGVVGYLLLNHGTAGALSAPEQAFLDRINQALLGAAGLAVLMGVVIGALLARTLTAPLAHISAASQAVAAGDFSRRVPEAGTAESRSLGRSFNRMAANLAQAEQLRRNLLADVAHELRTPLTVLQGNLQALLDGVYPLERSEVATLYDETRVLSRLVADLRDLAQAEAGQLALNVQSVDVAASLRQTVDALLPLAEQADLTLRITLPTDLPAARADADRVAQIVRNLLGNAIRYGKPGGMVLVTAMSERDRVRVEISDDGPGIAPADLPHLFDRFWRGDRARSRYAGGSGLGLAIVKHLAEAQGGQAGATSTVGHGATFWFTLPTA
ncbi:MAG: ATP-binding protein [Caldilineales bacterium]